MPPQYKPPYTVPAPNAQDVQGETAAMRHFLFKDKLVDKPDDLEKQTMWEMYLHGNKIGGGIKVCSCIFVWKAYMYIDRPFLGARRMENGVAKEYVWQTHKQVRERIDNFAKGLSTLGLKRQKSLGIYSVNRPEWVSFGWWWKKK